ncbi:Uma2 family endonuclease [Thiorhodospira sibirica]|uniref:Uma2 family endonuclease n=1 Tax=Thiorhodospira sibirica TaxID=154347 RepID=UPI00022C4639|nr:Uma2 family endonuclease [Thiorhodospira sibirica]
MPQTATHLPILIADYLEGEQHSDIRHEYIAGQVFAMAGASEIHNRISGNLFFHLRASTRGTSCGVFIGDMKVHVAKFESFYYPDVLLTCASDDREPFYKTAPCLIAEVLSPTTELTDRREKLIAYRTLAALHYYLLIAQEKRCVELYQRSASGQWLYQVYEQSGEIELNCPPIQRIITLDELYEDVVWNDAEPAMRDGGF